MRFYLSGALSLGGIDFGNLRRAHSHLMLFGWVTPALAILIVSRLPSFRTASLSIWGMLLLGLLSFPSFMIWGYESAAIGESRIPISIIVSTASMFAWYAFAAAWLMVRKRVETLTNRLARLAWDGAIALLVIGSTGAWARGALTGMGIEDPFLQSATVEFFLTCYSSGFLFIGVLGLILAKGESSETRGSLVALAALILMTPFEFLGALPVSLVPGELRPIGAFAMAVAGSATLYFAYRSKGRLDRVFLVILGSGKLVLVHPELATEALSLGLRIPYLHILLLGFVTIGLIEEAQRRWPMLVANTHVRAAIIISLVTLLPTTGLWPEAIPRVPGLLVTSLGAMLPVIAVVVALTRRRKSTHLGMLTVEENSCPR